MAKVAVRTQDGAAPSERTEEEEITNIERVWRYLIPRMLGPLEGCKHCAAGVPRPHIHER